MYDSQYLENIFMALAEISNKFSKTENDEGSG
jgi:hypothetical protein